MNIKTKTKTLLAIVKWLITTPLKWIWDNIPRSKYELSLLGNAFTFALIGVISTFIAVEARVARAPTEKIVTIPIEKETKEQVGIGTKAWAMQKWANRFGQKVAWQLEVIMDVGESGWDANAYHCNTNGTIDLSWYQINSVHIDNGKLSLACAADPICSTDFAMDLYAKQNWCPWYGARKLGFCK